MSCTSGFGDCSCYGFTPGIPPYPGWDPIPPTDLDIVTQWEYYQSLPNGLRLQAGNTKIDAPAPIVIGGGSVFSGALIAGSPVVPVLRDGGSIGLNNNLQIAGSRQMRAGNARVQILVHFPARGDVAGFDFYKAFIYAPSLILGWYNSTAGVGLGISGLTAAASNTTFNQLIIPNPISARYGFPGGHRSINTNPGSSLSLIPSRPGDSDTLFGTVFSRLRILNQDYLVSEYDFAGQDWTFEADFKFEFPSSGRVVFVVGFTRPTAPLNTGQPAFDDPSGPLNPVQPGFTARVRVSMPHNG